MIFLGFTNYPAKLGCRSHSCKNLSVNGRFCSVKGKNMLPMGVSGNIVSENSLKKRQKPFDREEIIQNFEP
jgi:hypothetical protein